MIIFYVRIPLRKEFFCEFLLFFINRIYFLCLTVYFSKLQWNLYRYQHLFKVRFSVNLLETEKLVEFCFCFLKYDKNSEILERRRNCFYFSVLFLSFVEIFFTQRNFG